MIIFFDIDGTLIDQRKAETIAARAFLERYGKRLERSYTLAEFCALWRQLREIHARGFLDGRLSWIEQQRRRMRDLFAAHEPRLCDSEADVRFRFYQRRYRESWALYDDVAQALPALSGHRLGIVSNGNVEQQNAKLRHTGIHHFFSVVLISEQAGIAKPDPGIFLAACAQAQCAPADAIHVGDRFELDVRPSYAAGMRAVWLDRSGSGTSSNGIGVIQSLLELAPQIRGRSAA
jgi:putative hydrolase of the HAD superfamily